MQPSLVLVSTPEAYALARLALERWQWSAHHAELGVPAIERAKDVLADVMLVQADADASACALFCAVARADADMADVRIFALAEGASAEERLAILEAGADDCWPEPLASLEVELRLAALRRRLLAAERSPAVRTGSLKLDLGRQTISAGGGGIWLADSKAQLLRLFMENSRTFFTVEQLRAHVWRDSQVGDLAVRRCVKRLNQALETIGAGSLIRTYDGGKTYIFDEEEDGRACA